MSGPYIKHNAKSDAEIRLAIIGMVEGNGHPYSWSAIVNGYDAEQMKQCPYPGIPAYLNRQPKHTIGIGGAKVTHIWTDNPDDAPKVAGASLIPHIVRRPEEVIGAVDAVIIATDIGGEHAERCKPFIEAGLPVFIDKPLTDNESDLRQFAKWAEEGKPILSSSCMRYAKEFMPYRMSTSDLGELRLITMTMSKSWERYGIHALEAVYPLLGPGFVSVRNTGSIERNVLHCKHNSGVDVLIANVSDLYGSFGVMQMSGTENYVTAAFRDTYYAFKTQLHDFIAYVRNGNRPFPFLETIELMRMVIAGIRSREEGGREIDLMEIQA